MIKWVAYIIVGFLFLVFMSLLVYRYYLKNSTKIQTYNGISSLEKKSLGGLEQWIFIRGSDQNNPVLIFLHGGPGAPMGGMSSSRKYDTELIKHFTVVHWDQRGAGKSFNKGIPIDSMTFDRLVEDCNELIDYIKNRFNVQKIFLVGHSGGSVIGLKTTYKYHEKIHAYVGVAQIVNHYEQQRLSYNFIVEEAKKSGNKKIQNDIKAIGSPPYDAPGKDMDKAKYIVQYGGFIRDNPIQQIMATQLMFLTSPEYSLSEGTRTILNKGLDFTMDAMWEEIRSINFTNEIKSIDVPIYFFVGKYDMITPAVPIEDFYNDLEAQKGKKLVIFENSAHVPMLEEKEKFDELLINMVLKERLKKSK